MQQGDVKLFHTADGGEIDISGGLFAMDGGLETAAYLALFGGNESDSGLDDDLAQWWGNDGEPTERTYRSETQNLLRSLPLVPANLRRLEDAAKRDLAFFKNQTIASLVEVEATMPALNTVDFNVTIEAEGLESEFKFSVNWSESFSSQEIIGDAPQDVLSVGLRLLVEDGSYFLTEDSKLLLLENDL